MKEKVEFRKLREFGEVIGDTLLFIKQNFGPLFKAVCYLCGLFIVGSMVSAILTQLQIVSLATSPPVDEMDGYNGPFGFIYNLGINYLFLFLFMILSYTAIYVSVLSFIALYIKKERTAPTVEEVWGYFKYYFWRVFGSTIGVSLIFGGVLAIFLFLLYAVSPVLMGMGIVFVVIPFFFYFFPTLTLFYPVMIMENGSMWYSLGRAHKLLKGNWWISVATIIVIYIIFYASSMIIQLPAIIIAMFSAFTHLDQPITKTYAVVTSIGQNLSQILLLIPISCSALIYFNLVERKESSGLLQRIEGLGQNTTTPPTENIPEEY